MQTKTKEADTRDRELDEELAGILSAISVVSKRLAKKLLTLQHQGGRKGEGGRRMGKTGDWSEAVTELKNAAQALSGAADLLTNFFSGNVENGESKPEEKPVTLEAVRTVLADKSRSGFTAQVRTLIEKYGASKLSEVDPGNYKALMADAGVLGNE